jgi:hypothetical protein
MCLATIHCQAFSNTNWIWLKNTFTSYYIVRGIDLSLYYICNQTERH